MSLLLHESTALSVSRQEMLQWAADNYGAVVRLQVLKGSMIPRRLPAMMRPTADWLRQKRRLPRSSRCSSTLTEDHTGSDNTIQPIETKLRALLDKPSKSKLDLDTIRSLVTDTEVPASSSPQDRHEALLLLLKYKKYDWLLEILQNDLRDHVDEAILIETLAITSKHDQISAFLSSKDLKERQIILATAVHDLTETILRPKVALELWLSTALISHPTMKVVHQKNSKPLMSSLLSILSKFDTPKYVITYAFKHLQTDEHRAHFLQSLSYAYYMLSRPDLIIKVWENTPREMISSNILSNTIQAYTSTKQYDDALRIFNQNKTLQTRKMLTDLVAAVTGLKYKGRSFATLRRQVSEGVIDEFKFIRIMKTLLFEKRLKDFDTLKDLYMLSASKFSPSFHNVLMQRALIEGDAQKFFDHLRLIYEKKKQPTQLTFRLLFEQFESQGQLSDAMKLLEVLIQRNKEVSIHIFTSLVGLCEKGQSLTQLTNLLVLMKRLGVQPDDKFKCALISALYSFKHFDRLQQVYDQINLPYRSPKVVTVLMKSYLMQGNFPKAREAYKTLCSLQHEDRPAFYLAKLQFFTLQGHFYDAISVVNKMEKLGIRMDSRHYAALMRGYNKFQKYDDTMVVFGTALDSDCMLDSVVFREALVSMVKSGIINEKNFDKPTAAVDEILSRYRNDELQVQGKLRFKAVQPLVKTLIKFYKPDEAFRIMGDYASVREDFDVNSNLNFMRQEMLLFASQKKWKSFESAYVSFQESVRESLVDDGEAPIRMKKIYNSIIKVIFDYYKVKKDVKGFVTLFQDLIFVHGFTFDSHRLNWIVRQLLKRRSTLHSGLKIVEAKLIGGRIAKELVKSEKAKMRRLGKSPKPNTYKGRTMKPHISLGYVQEHRLNDILYKHILNSSRKLKKPTNEILDHYNRFYPKTMKNLSELHARLRRRERVLQKRRAATVQR